MILNIYEIMFQNEMKNDQSKKWLRNDDVRLDRSSCMPKRSVSGAKVVAQGLYGRSKKYFRSKSCISRAAVCLVG